MDEWIEFYTSFFISREEAALFVERFESLSLEHSRHPAKIMMHQTKRMVSLADDLPKIRPQREALQLLFLLICAEHISKLHDNFEGEGQSRAYTRRFFEELLPKSYRDTLERGFSSIDCQPLTVRKIVDLLYDVRCDVVHEGRYWGFHFHDGRTRMLNTDPDVIVNMRFEELREIVVHGCIEAVHKYGGRRPQSRRSG
jgi:hypothetical protein